jgi:GrpB-like predicted nucleotidyltransferase (UPF0157 family)
MLGNSPRGQGERILESPVERVGPECPSGDVNVNLLLYSIRRARHRARTATPHCGADSMPDDRIQIVEYNPAWPSEFTSEARLIRAMLGQLVLRIDHVGSTAIPGLGAKPIIDIQISVASLQPIAAFDDLLELIGYTHIRVGEFDTVYPFYQRPAEWQPTHHILCRHGSRELIHPVSRDYLRDH